MSKSIQALREKKTEISRAANALLTEKGAQVWSAEDKAKFDGFADEIERVSAQIDAHQQLLDEEAQKIIPKVKDSVAEKTEHRAAFELFMRKMTKELAPEEAQFIRATMSTTTGSQGGYTVPTQVSTELVNALKDYAGMRRVASRILTGTGQQISFPTSDGTAEIGEIVAQNAAVAAADPTFGVVTLGAYKFSSKVIKVPIELLQDSAVDIVAFIQQRMRDRIGRIQNNKYTVGSGTNEPNGLVTAATVGKTGATGQTVTITYDDLVDLSDSVDIAYLSEGDLTWQFGQTLRRVIRKIKDTAGRPIWTPSYDAGIGKGTPDLLLGYPVNINNDMPTPAANAKSLSFGQHGKYTIRDSMEVNIWRFEDSVYVQNGQVGFLAMCRSDGNLLDVNGIRTYQHSAT